MGSITSGSGGAVRRHPTRSTIAVLLVLLVGLAGVLWWRAERKPDDLPTLLDRVTQQVGGGGIANFYHAPGVLTLTLVTDSGTRTLEYQHSLWGDEIRDTTDSEFTGEASFHLPLDRLDVEGILERSPDRGGCPDRRIGMTVQVSPSGEPLALYRCTRGTDRRALAAYLGAEPLPLPTVAGEAALIDPVAWDSALETARSVLGESWTSLLIGGSGDQSVQISGTGTTLPGATHCEPTLRQPLASDDGVWVISCLAPIVPGQARAPFSAGEVTADDIVRVLGQPGVDPGGMVTLWRSPESGGLILQCVVDGTPTAFDLVTGEPA